jgi:hypothetical protein
MVMIFAQRPIGQSLFECCFFLSEGPRAKRFGKRFTFVPEESTIAAVGNGAAPLALLHKKAPKNGYCMVFVCNKSLVPVYFDDLQVRHDRGRILEENHYYA